MPGCHATRTLTRARRVGVRGALIPRSRRAVKAGVARVWRGYNNRFKRPAARFWCWPIRWPTRGLFLALLGLLGALAGLCCWRAMLRRARAGLQCLFSLYECAVLGGHTVCLAYGLAYVLS